MAARVARVRVPLGCVQRWRSTSAALMQPVPVARVAPAHHTTLAPMRQYVATSCRPSSQLEVPSELTK